MHALLQTAFDREDFSTLLEAFPSGVVVTNEAGLISYVNSVLTKQFGYDRQDLLGQPVDLLLPEQYRDAHRRYVAEYIARPENRDGGSRHESFGCCKDGRRFPIEIALNAITTEQGYQVLATILARSRRLQLENNFRDIIEAAPVGMLVVDASGHIVLGNKLLSDIFGYSSEELRGQSLELLLPERYREHHVAYRESFAENPANRNMGVGRELTGRRKGGMEVLVEIGLSPIELEDGQAVIAAVNDISERRKNELNLRRAYADLDEFTYVASHDLKSPLRGISNLLEWIEEDLGESIPDTVKNNLDRTNLRIERMEKLVDDLLRYARAGTRYGAFTEVDVRALIDDVVELADLPPAFEISTDIGIDVLQTPRTPLETVLRNLISNAVKHHDRDTGHIEIRVSADDSFALFEVLDDGPGIPSIACERIFKLFQTLHGDKDNRSGVGLAVTKRLIEAHDGAIEVQTRDGQRGALFRFWWPRFARSDLHACGD